MTYVIDRIEDGIMTLIPDDGDDIINIPYADGYTAGMSVDFENGMIMRIDSELNEKTFENNKQRLKNLFNRKGNNNEN